MRLPSISLPKLPSLPSVSGVRDALPHGDYVAARAPTAAEVAAAKAALGGELPVRVVTFNTAVGNSAITTRQADFPQLPFYRDVIEGKPNAPILALQEVGPEQAAELKRLASNGKFSVLFAHARPGQGNALLIPNRYEVVTQRSQALLEGQVKGVARSIVDRVTGSGPEQDTGQLVEPRMFSEAQLVDRFTGKRLTVFNTHISAYDPVGVAQAEQLFGEVRKAEARGPVILAGDLNTRTALTQAPGSVDAKVRALFGPLEDMGAPQAPSPRTNIDWILADGFDAGTSRWYQGASLALPGSPSAETVSDHYAEEDVFTYE